MAHEVRLRDGAQAILQRPISDAEFAAFDAVYAGTSGSLEDRLTSSFSTIADDGSASSVRSVISFYQVFYGRQPDAGGLNYWTDLVDSGAIGLNQLANEFSAASEFNSRFGDRTPVEVVAAQYANVLGRSPDIEGLNFWAGQVSSGALTLADLGRFFATSDEAQARFDPFIDSFLVNNANGDQDFDTNQSLFQEELVGGTGSANAPISLAGQTGPVTGTAGGDTFAAESGDLSSSSNINGGAGRDALTVFNETQGNAVSPRMQGVETVVWTEQTNDRDSNADNNVGGYGNLDNTTEVDVELDAGRISGVNRWEDFDSRADLVIEDIRDGNDVDGTFTGDLTVAMVSTDPGNVDYATYFDQPVNRPGQNTSAVFLEVLDLDTADTISQASVDGNTQGVLNDATLSQFTIRYNDAPVTIVLFDREAAINDTVPAPAGVVGPTATYNTLITAIQAAIDANPVLGGQGLVVSLGEAFNETASPQNSVGAGREIFGRQVQIDAPAGNTLEAISRVAFSDDPSRAIAARITGETTAGTEELIRLNIDLDDVGKGSMGGDLLAGAMSTGRQIGDDGTSDSQGIQQFDIRVDRSSQLQTINSTNNALEVVTIVNGENAGPNNTTTAIDEQTGDLVVRGRANPATNDGPGGTNVNSSAANVQTDNAMPGALPQHDDFGFNDVRVINASAMIGDVDLTVDLSNQIVEKYLENDDTEVTGNGDDELFSYNLGRGDDEFLINMSGDALIDVGTASREDFNLVVNGNDGDDSIVTNVGTAVKFIDNQGQDFYDLNESSAWYSNQANNDAATFTVTGGGGNDTIWTHGWGDATISGGFGSDTVYTDNSGTVDRTDGPAVLDIFRDLTRNITEADGRVEQIDYQVGAVWTFNDDNGGDDEADADGNGNVSNISGSTNDGVNIGVRANNGTVYTTNLTVSFFGANGNGNDATAYTATVSIPQSSILADGTISDQVMTQAIKRAVNDDPVLNKVMEAVDGPGQSLAVYSKIDGDFANDDLEISLFETQQPFGGGALVLNDVDLDGTGYDTTGSDFTDFQNFGRASVAESDNTISIRADNAADVTVLSTNDDDDDDDADIADNGTGITNGASNETLVVEEGNFGVETIFNFGASDAGDADVGGRDFFDFRAIDFVPGTSGFSNDGTANQGNDSISIIAETTGNDTAAEVAALFNGTNATALEHLVIVYDDNAGSFDIADNTGTVYLVTNPAGAGATATIQGEINLIGTAWTDLEADNFL